MVEKKTERLLPFDSQRSTVLHSEYRYIIRRESAVAQEMTPAFQAADASPFFYTILEKAERMMNCGSAFFGSRLKQ